MPPLAKMHLPNGKARSATTEDFRVMDWGEWKASGQKSNIRRALLTNKPLYGGRDAPLRWFLRISSFFRQGGWRQLRTDCCSFERYELNRDKSVRRVTSFLIVYVGDILLAADQAGRNLFKTATQQMVVGEVKFLSIGGDLDFIGQQLSLDKRGSICLSVAKFVDSLQEIVLIEVYQKQQFTTPSGRRMALFLQVAVSLLWAVQVYFEISHGVTLLGTSINEAAVTVEGAETFFTRYNRAVKPLKSSMSIIRYHSFGNLRRNSSSDLTRPLTLVGFLMHDSGV